MTLSTSIPASTSPQAFPSLVRLGVEPGHFGSLAVQGFLSAEDRGGKNLIVKLRYRFGGRQLVKYVGSDPRVIDSVRDELRLLQQAHRQDRELRQLVASARTLLRRSKRLLLPSLTARGCTFHGYAIRRSAARKKQ